MSRTLVQNGRYFEQTVLTLKQFISSWSLQSVRLSLNAWNFEVRAAKEAVATFRRSFDLHRFNDNNTLGWARRSHWFTEKARHPIMNLDGILKNSIKWQPQNGRNGNKIAQVYTDPKDFSMSSKHKGFCYANVHNDEDSSVRTGAVANMPQRQFIGYSDLLDETIEKEHIPVIFSGFHISEVM